MHINDMDIQILRLIYKDVYTTTGLSKKMKIYEQIIRKHILKLNKYGFVDKVPKLNKFIYIANTKRVSIGEDFVLLKQDKKTVHIITETGSELYKLGKSLAR